MSLISQKPYLIRAMHEWISDNNHTVYIIALVTHNTLVPQQYVQDNNQITLNITNQATQNLNISNEKITFQANFAGAVNSIEIPIANIIAIFAKESNLGMQFEVDSKELNGPSATSTTSGLKLVK